MILVILVFSLVCILAGVIGRKKKWDDFSTTGCFVVGGVLSFATTAVVIGLISIVCTDGSIIDNKLEMYKRENQKIEQSVSLAVKDYLDHENKIYNNITAENAVTTVIMAYPELASKEIVKNQIQLYESNNEKIKELETEKIELSKARFWLYFGY